MSTFLEDYGRGERNFAEINLQGHTLSGETLRDCDFREASFTNCWVTSNHFENCDFTGADLSDAWLAKNQFLNCRFDRTSIVCSYFASSHVLRSTFTYSYLTGTNFVECDVALCDFSNARLYRVRVERTKFINSAFHGADIERAIFADSSFENIANSFDVRHGDGCNVDWLSIALSLRSDNVEQFLRASGMPDVFILYSLDCARAMDPAGVFKLMRSTFISYGGPDAGFAEVLCEVLQRSGVRAFLFSRDAVPGKKLHDTMRDGVASYDRVILICSKAALDRPGVQYELEQVLAREARSGGESYLIPITLDDYVFHWNPGRPGLAQEVRDRVVADFRGADEDPEKFNQGFMRLLRALRN